MTHFTDVTGLLGSAIAIGVVSANMPGVSRMSRARRSWLLAAVLVAALIPIGGLSVAGYMRGAVGDLSVTTLVLLVAASLHSLRGWPIAPDRNKLMLLMVAAAVVFYPLALGVGDFDPYRLGYGSYGLLALLLVLALAAVWRGLPTMAFAISLGVLAWSVGWYESTNLWDYLLDPLVAAYALVALTTHGIHTLRAG